MRDPALHGEDIRRSGAQLERVIDRVRPAPAPSPFDIPLAELRRRQSFKWTHYAPDVLPLPIAEMDVRLAPPIAAALRAAIDDSDTGYAGDSQALIAAFGSFAQRRWNWRIEHEHVRVCADVASGIRDVLHRLASPGDGVIVMPPVYPPFYAWLREMGLRAVQVPLREPESGGRLDLDTIAAAFAAGARIVLLCHPHNPTGRVHERDELRALAELAARFDAVVLSDEIHGPLVYRSAEFAPYLTVSDQARATGFAFTSASKAWNLAGLKCALIVAGSSAHVRLLERIPADRAFGAGLLGMIANTAAFAAGTDWLDELIVGLEANLALLRAELATRLPRVSMAMPRATYLAWLDLSAYELAQEPATVVLERGRLALTPGGPFGAPGAHHARLNFACSQDVIREAVARIVTAIGV
jgi:cystathionine beta-lyase